MNDQNNPDAWDTTPKKELKLSEMDALIRDWKEKQAVYEEKKLISNEAFRGYEDAKNLVLKELVDAGKKRYAVDGLGGVTVSEIFKVTTPKSLEDKQAFFDYLRDKGHEVFLDKLNINYGSLQSFYNAEFENCPVPEKGAFSIPGIGAPTLYQSLLWKKEAKK